MNNSNNFSPEKNKLKSKPDSIIADQQESRSINSRSNTPKLNNKMRKSDDLKSYTTKLQNYNNQILLTDTSKIVSNQKINSKLTTKDNGFLKIDKLNEKLFPTKKIINNRNLDVSSYLDKIKKADFSCCTISNLLLAQEKLYKLCISNKIIIKEVN